jgi:hypothetical protein
LRIYKLGDEDPKDFSDTDKDVKKAQLEKKVKR